MRTPVGVEELADTAGRPGALCGVGVNVAREYSAKEERNATSSTSVNALSQSGDGDAPPRMTASAFSDLEIKNYLSPLASRRMRGWEERGDARAERCTARSVLPYLMSVIFFVSTYSPALIW